MSERTSIVEQLKGDARHKVVPYLPKGGQTGDRSWFCPQPMKIPKSIANHLIEGFLKGVSSSHSVQGGTLWMVVRYCTENKMPYILQVHPGYGASIRKVES